MNVLVAYNGLETGLEASRPALEEAAKLAKKYGLGAEREPAKTGEGQIVVLSVVPPDVRTGAQVNFGPHAGDDVALAHAFLRERGIESEMKVANGDPAEEILKEARQGGYDLLIVGTRGLGPVGRLLLGSVSSKVADRSPCPVLVVSEGKIERIEPKGAS